MTPGCINEGGLPSLITLDHEPALEQEIALDARAGAALYRWDCPLGSIVTVAGPDGTFFRARITAYTPLPRIVPFQRLARPVESPIQIDILHALPGKERFELVLEKVTEIGVTRIVPLVSKRSTTLRERDAKQKKSHRWPAVIRRAALQCRRAVIPELFPMLDWQAALAFGGESDLRLILCEHESTGSLLKELLCREIPRRVAILVGPEGGFEQGELASAKQQGFLPVSLGGRLLRTETAAILGAALVQYHLGDLG